MVLEHQYSVNFVESKKIVHVLYGCITSLTICSTFVSCDVAQNAESVSHHQLKIFSKKLLKPRMFKIKLFCVSKNNPGSKAKI